MYDSEGVDHAAVLHGSPPFSLHRRFESLMSLGANSKKEREQFKRKMQSRKLEQEELPEGRSPQSGDFPGPALRPCFAH